MPRVGEPAGRREVARRDRPGARRAMRHPGARRADGGAARGRRRAPARRAAAAARRAASASSMSPTASTRSSASPTGSRCCATAGAWRPSRVAETTPGDARPEDRRPLADRRLRQAARRRRPHRARRSTDAGRRATSVRSPSRSPPARSSGWSGCAAPATTPSAARSSATIADRRPAQCRWAARRSIARDPRDAIARAHRLRLQQARRGEPRANMTVRENLFMNPVTTGHQARCSRSAPAAEQRALPARRSSRFSVRPPEPERPIATLSGGNQQKVVVARWMEARQPPARARGADLRRRRRLQGGDLPAPPAGARRRARRAADLVGFRGGRAASATAP